MNIQWTRSPALYVTIFQWLRLLLSCWRSQLIGGLCGTESSSRLPQTSACPIRAGLPHHRNEQSSDLSAQRQMAVGLQLRRRHLPRPLAEMGDTVILWAFGVAFMAVTPNTTSLQVPTFAITYGCLPKEKQQNTMGCLGTVTISGRLRPLRRWTLCCSVMVWLFRYVNLPDPSLSLHLLC